MNKSNLIIILFAAAAVALIIYYFNKNKKEVSKIENAAIPVKQATALTTVAGENKAITESKGTVIGGFSL